MAERRLRIVNAEAILPPGRIAAAEIVCRGDRIISVGEAAKPSATEVLVDGRGLTVVPGFIDLQVNGGYGIDIAREPHRLSELAWQLLAHGVCSWQPTLVSSPSDKTIAFLAAVDAVQDGADGEWCIGAHLEGPAIAPESRGAHRNEAIVAAADAAAVVAEAHVRFGDSVVSMVTLAPERPGAAAFIESLVAAGIVASVGHTAASAEQVHAAADLGVTSATHLFNAMAGFHHRNPGPAGGVLADDRLVVGLIADGIHLHPDALRIAWSVLGAGRTALVSDSTAALGLPLGRSRLGDVEVDIADDGAVRTADGVLAGSSVGLDRSLRILRKVTKCGLADAVATVTETPAALLGLDDRGRVATGRRADLVLLDPRGEVRMTVRGGEVVYRAEAAAQAEFDAAGDGDE